MAVDVDEEEDTSASIPSYRFQWDVFLSFSGEDTRHNFTQELYNELVRNGVRTFRDEEELRRGEEIAPSLSAAIADSAAAIAVISKNYASSKWCLEELAKILESKKLLLPVFYKVDPSDVRRQKGPFEEAFRKHQQAVADTAKISRWREAMVKAGNISGWDSKLWEDSKLIETLTRIVLSKLDNTPLGVAKYPVGINPVLDELLRKLDVKANGVLLLGISGMGGIGKTTLAKALYNRLVRHFKWRCFISDIRESASSDALTSLQCKIIGDLAASAPPTINDKSRGIIYIKQTISDKPVLLVLDDVDHVNQLNMLAGGKDWFYEGSRIIITARDKNVLRNFVDEIYEIEKLSFAESLQLFSYHAFGRDEPTSKFMDISKEVVSLTGGLPLALEVFGSSLFHKRRMKEWKDVLEKLKKIRPVRLQDVLEVSFDSLDEQEKNIFLDLACVFAHTNLRREDAVDIFRGCGHNAEIAITDLTAKSLIKIIDKNTIWMHEQLRDMGRQIVQRENRDVGKRSRLWDQDEILEVLRTELGTRSIECIALDFTETSDPSPDTLNRNNCRTRSGLASGIAHLKLLCKKYFGHGAERDNAIYTKSFQAMVNLRLLKINHAKLNGNYKLIPPQLKWFQWKGCPLKVLPDAFQLQYLAVLDLSESKIRQLWARRKMTKKLLVMNLHDCYHLTDIPDLSGICLEKLILERCTALVKIHKSIGDMSTLTYLTLKDCKNLLELPSDVSGLKSLEKLVLSGCSSLGKIPEDMSGLKSLKELLLDGTAIDHLPESIFRLKNLELLKLDDCQSLSLLPLSIGNLNSLKELSMAGSSIQELPHSVKNLTNLEELNMRGCKSLVALPDSIGDMKSLVQLHLDNSSIQLLPESIGSLSHLKSLTLSRCRSLNRLPDSIGGLSSLVWLSLEHTLISEVPNQVGNIKTVEKFEMGYCMSLKALPDSVGCMSSLTILALDSLSIAELPESIGLLEFLKTLKLNNCKNLKLLPASIGGLRSLQYLLMAETAVAELPSQLGRLSNLRSLLIAKEPQLGQHQNNSGYSPPSVLPDSFSNLSLLENLDARSWKFSGKISDDFEKLSSLETLNLGDNNFCSLPSSLLGLSSLKNLILPKCKELKYLPPLPSSLLRLNVANCTALEGLSDLSELESLWELDFTNCKKITDIPGLECLKSLKRLYAGGCNACLASLRKRLSKAALKHIRFLCVPGSDMPDWFLPHLPTFRRHKNRELKSILIGVIVSLDQHVQDRFRTKVPAIVDIQAKILRLNNPVYTTTLNLNGVPDTDDDQFYLCRFHDYNQLVFMLEDGDNLEVAMRETPRFSGLKLKRHGIYLVYEDDDNFDDNDDALFPESQQSVSKKLANFFNSL